MATAVLCLIQRLAHRLPRYRPVIRTVIVPQIHIEARSVHGHRVAPETADPVVLRRLVEKIAARRVVHHRRHILHAEIIRPRAGQIHPVDDILPVFVVKMSVFHVPSIPERLRDGETQTSNLRLPSDKFVTLRHKFTCEKGGASMRFFHTLRPILAPS